MDRRVKDFLDGIEIDSFSVSEWDADGNPRVVVLREGDAIVGECYMVWENGNLRNVIFEFIKPPLEFYVR